MPSAITGIIGGIQGASAAHHAADKLSAGYGEAGDIVTKAVQDVNPDILKTAQEQGAGVVSAGQRAGEEAVSTAGEGAAGATSAAAAGGAAATDAAKNFANLLQPYIGAGTSAMGQIVAGLAPGGTFSKPFTADMMAQYSPAYQFQLKQGTDAANRQLAAMGLSGSGGAARSLQRYTQDYAGTAFQRANDIYAQQQRDIFGRLSTVANYGMGAATTAGEAAQQAAEYGGTLGERAAEYGGTLRENAAQYKGNTGIGTQEWAGTANINARNLAASNTLGAADYLASTKVDAAKAMAQGDLGAAAGWNQMLGGIGSVGNAIAFGGLDPTGGGGWSPSNIGKNIWGGGFGRPTGVNYANYNYGGYTPQPAYSGG